MILSLGARLLPFVAALAIAGCETQASRPQAVPQTTLTPAPMPTPSAVTQAQPSSAAAPREPVNQPTDGVRHIVATPDAQLLLRRPAWSIAVPASFGTLLAAGDVVSITEGSVTIVCADLTTQVLRPGIELIVADDICASGDTAYITVADGLAAAMRGRNRELPFLISPRSTALRKAQPVIRWNDTGNPPYSVLITAEGYEWRAEGIQGTRLDYDGVPPLTPGIVYLITVIDSAGRSSDEELARGLGFWLLDPAAAAEATGTIERISRADLPAESVAYLRAWLLCGSELRAEAAAELEALTAAGQGGAAAPLALGDLYRRQGLTLLAKAAYAQAAVRAEDVGDEPMLAAAEAGLGDMLYQLDEAQAAVARLTSAYARFAKLGDESRAAEIRDLITQIQ